MKTLVRRAVRRRSPRVVFVAVVLATGAASLATWCLTTDAGSPFPFR